MEVRHYAREDLIVGPKPPAQRRPAPSDRSKGIRLDGVLVSPVSPLALLLLAPLAFLFPPPGQLGDTLPRLG
jgi:hypothetical protein